MKVSNEMHSVKDVKKRSTHSALPSAALLSTTSFNVIWYTSKTEFITKQSASCNNSASRSRLLRKRWLQWRCVMIFIHLQSWILAKNTHSPQKQEEKTETNSWLNWREPWTSEPTPPATCIVSTVDSLPASYVNPGSRLEASLATRGQSIILLHAIHAWPQKLW